MRKNAKCEQQNDMVEMVNSLRKDMEALREVVSHLHYEFEMQKKEDEEADDSCSNRGGPKRYVLLEGRSLDKLVTTLRREIDRHITPKLPKYMWNVQIP